MDLVCGEEILLDMDGVTVDFYGGTTDRWRQENPNEFFIPTEEIRHFFIREGYPEHLRERITELHCRKGFFLNLPLIPGALEGVKHLLRHWRGVRICTTPIPESLFCIDEKREYILRYFGPRLADSIIFANDKTVIPGRFLIDDRSEIAGMQKPTWEHILFAAPHNRHVVDRPRVDWKDIIKMFPA